jgi:hypothetical protein
VVKKLFLWLLITAQFNSHLAYDLLNKRDFNNLSEYLIQFNENYEDADFQFLLGKIYRYNDDRIKSVKHFNQAILFVEENNQCLLANIYDEYCCI